jgi:hypothetical protein
MRKLCNVVFAMALVLTASVSFAEQFVCTVGTSDANGDFNEMGSLDVDTTDEQGYLVELATNYYLYCGGDHEVQPAALVCAYLTSDVAREKIKKLNLRKPSRDYHLKSIGAADVASSLFVLGDTSHNNTQHMTYCMK